MAETSPSEILLIEDDAEIVDFIETELRFEGYVVHVARDGLKGLQMARQSTPDLIILDRMLPGMDGLTLCRRLRQSSEIPILMLTALGDIGHRVEGPRHERSDPVHHLVNVGARGTVVAADRAAEPRIVVCTGVGERSHLVRRVDRRGHVAKQVVDHHQRMATDPDMAQLGAHALLP